MKKLLGAVGFSILLLGSTATWAASNTSKVGIIDVYSVLQQMPQRELVAKKLETEFSARAKDLQAEQKTAQANLDKLQKESLTLSAAQKKKLEDAVSSFEAKAKAFSEDYQRRENEEVGKLLEKIQSTVKTVAQKDKYTLVVRSDAVIYVDEANNITDEVLKQVAK